MTATRELHLVRTPKGALEEDGFKLVETVLPEPRDGEVAVENVYLSIDPATRPRLSHGHALNTTVMGFALGRVTQSRHADFREGDIVRSAFGYREHFVADGRYLGKLSPDPALPLTVYLHVLGGTGFVAYGGLLAIAKMQAGETVFVSTAAGAVGSIAVQVARLKGATVIGSTGSDNKANWLKSLGLNGVINYKRRPIAEALREAAPKGIDVYFDNVGGEHLEAALACMNSLGRVAVCGMISTYNDDPIGVRNLSSIIYNRINIRGFVTTDFDDLHPKFLEEMTAWIKAEKVEYRETIMDGIENASAALIALLNGVNTGKMMVKL
ncbi:MAG: NADP-dependent oxidoreductase [Rhizomicrobium sp.]